MHQEFSDEQLMLRDSADRYLRDNYGFEQRQASLRSDAGFSRHHWREFAQMGWLAMPFAEDCGGLGAGATETMLLCEVFGRHLVREPYLETVILAGGLVQHGASAALQQQYLPAIAEGQLHGAFAYAEPQRQLALLHVGTEARRDGEGYEISGRKCSVSNGPAAALLLVTARTAGAPGSASGLSLFAVEAGARGLSRRDYATHDGRHASELVLDRVRVTRDAVVGELDAAVPLIEKIVDQALLALGAEAVGAMLELTQACIEYTRQRRQFGKALASFQVLRHRMADMYIQCELTRSLLIAAAAKLDARAVDAPCFVAALKARVGKAARFVGQSAIQLHGGIGMTDELKVGHYFKRLTVIENLFGARDHHLERFAGLRASDAGAGADT